MEARIQLQRRRRAQMRLALWLGLAVILVVFREVLFPFLMGALLAYLLQPLVNALSSLVVPGLGGWRLPPWLSLLLLYLLGCAALILLGWLLVPTLYRETLRLGLRMSRWLEESQGRLPAWVDQAHSWLHSHGFPMDEGEVGEDVLPPPRLDLGELLRRFPSAIEGRFFEFFGMGQRLVTGIFSGIFTVLLILMSAAFFLTGRAQIFGFIRRLFPERGQGGLDQLLRRLDNRLSGVVRGQVTICLINGTLTLIGLLLFRIEFPFVLAAQATGFSLIPIFGTFISSVPILMIALQQGLSVGLSMLGWILAIHALEAYVLNPKILGEAASIHPLVILFALVAGEHTFGLWGAFLAAPVAAVLVAIFEQTESWAEGAIL